MTSAPSTFILRHLLLTNPNQHRKHISYIASRESRSYSLISIVIMKISFLLVGTRIAYKSPIPKVGLRSFRFFNICHTFRFDLILPQFVYDTCIAMKHLSSDNERIKPKIEKHRKFSLPSPQVSAANLVVSCSKQHSIHVT